MSKISTCQCNFRHPKTYQCKSFKEICLWNLKPKTRNLRISRKFQLRMGSKTKSRWSRRCTVGKLRSWGSRSGPSQPWICPCSFPRKPWALKLRRSALSDRRPCRRGSRRYWMGRWTWTGRLTLSRPVSPANLISTVERRRWSTKTA